MEKTEIRIFQSESGQTEVHVKFEKETVWLSQKQMAQLFEKGPDTIGLHLKNIYRSSELEETATTEDSSVVQLEGRRRVKRKIKFYNLDAMIAVSQPDEKNTMIKVVVNLINKKN
nr:hypothetical protein [Bacteroidota bacterium]